ncbi:MAG: alkaline phosphatase family protein [Thiocapsa sp.]|uniref:alkaline phosphatase family protein n=1 Tax=Thiocapsa sp. TaxID=2024551 RepID=UPI001BD08061|nr:alkaline phosphatase family protein [Thiocapsa sp.]QVL47470.1 MAG: alkaline phosphatase family protein [Thiocapsa sp.]
MNDKKAPPISIVVFIDALGWEVLKGRRFMEDRLPFRRKLRSVFGFSSACIPSILTGKMPRDHLHWSFFYYSPETSPFKPLRLLGLLPSSLIDRGRVRNLISKLIKRLYGYTGYFQLYNIPFQYVDKFDYCEKNDLFVPGGMNRSQNIFDHLSHAGVTYHVSDWRKCEEDNLDALKSDLEKGEIAFAFLYMASMDALLHEVGKESPRVDQKLAWYEAQLENVLQIASTHYEQVRLFICSDHGMATVHTSIDLMSKIEALGLVFGRDYTATYDSTMGRFWFHNPTARKPIVALLEQVPEGRILSQEELKRLGCDFEGDQFGELIFLMEAGTLIVPSHMGLKPITGMHGYHPDHPDSDASLLSNVEPPNDPGAITDIFHLMRAESGA